MVAFGDISEDEVALDYCQEQTEAMFSEIVGSEIVLQIDSYTVLENYIIYRVRGLNS